MQRLLLAAALVAAVIAGAWSFPSALHPVGGERHRIVLNDLVDHGRGSVGNDWFRNSARATVTATDRSISVSAPQDARHELELTSRELPVFAHDCYALNVNITTRRPGAEVAVYDENLVKRIADVGLTTRGRETHTVRFEAPDERPISLTVYGSRGSDITIHDASLQRLSTSCP